MKPLRFLPAAQTELNEAAAYYEARHRDLGKRFLACVQDACNRILINPLSYRVVESDVRRCFTQTFPFGVLFRVTPEQVVIIAVMHLHRDPDYWKQRLSTDDAS